METKQTIRAEEEGKRRINEGQEKGNRRNISTNRPKIKPAPQKQNKRENKK